VCACVGVLHLHTVILHIRPVCLTRNWLEIFAEFLLLHSSTLVTFCCCCCCCCFCTLPFAIYSTSYCCCYCCRIARVACSAYWHSIPFKFYKLKSLPFFFCSIRFELKIAIRERPKPGMGHNQRFPYLIVEFLILYFPFALAFMR